MATTISGNTITHGDGSVQGKASVVPSIQTFLTPGTFTIPSSTTKIKVYMTASTPGSNGLRGDGPATGGAGASGTTTSFGPLMSLTTNAGNVPTSGSTLRDAGGFYIGVFNAPFPTSSMPVVVGVGGGGGGGGSGGFNVNGLPGSPASGVNGGNGGNGTGDAQGGRGRGGGGGGGASGGTIGAAGSNGTGPSPLGAAQPGTTWTAFARTSSGGLGGQQGGGTGGESSQPALTGGTGGIGGFVIVEF